MGTRGCIWSRTPAPQGCLHRAKALLDVDHRWGRGCGFKPTAAGLFTVRVPALDKQKWNGDFTPRQEGSWASPVVWGLFLWQPLRAGCVSGVTTVDLIGVTEAQAVQGGECQPVLPQAAQGTCPWLWGSPGNLLGLEGLWVPAQHRGLGSQVWPQEAVVAVSLARLNSYNSPPSSLPQVIGCEWLSLYVIFGILQFLFTQLTDPCYLFFRLEWFLFSCLDPDLHKKYEHSCFNLITVAKYLPKCLFLFGQTNRSKCICLQPGKLCFAHLTS